MSRALMLRFACATQDCDVIVDALRAICPAPIHIRQETVRGIDYDDAGTSERVTGALRRMAIELMIGEEDVQRFTDAVAQARRRLPVRWMLIPVVAQGRIV